MSDLGIVLHEGLLIKTKYTLSENWYYSINRSFYNDTVVIDVNGRSPEHEELIGKDIIISIYSPSSEYLLEGKILAVDNSFPATCKVKIQSEQQFSNRRRHYRFLTNFGGMIKLSMNTAASFSFITNLSLNGACVDSSIELDFKNAIMLNFVTHKNAQLSVWGKIVWKKSIGGKTFYGIAFENNKPDVLFVLEEYLKYLDKLENTLLNQWNKYTPGNIPDKLPTKILLVDDIKMTRDYIKGILSSIGDFQVFEAANGNDAVHQSLLFKPDVISLDISMPGINGLEALKFIRKSSIYSDVIVVSANISPEIEKVFKTLGVKHFISKPFDKDIFIDALNNVLGRKSDD